ncbi:hypothetical protein Q2T40_00960 [Winogradskyella maritima]|nr:hypothetical protein [Winogradskyella maritima]
MKKPWSKNGRRPAIIDAQQKTGKLCQIGSQAMASLGNEKAKQLYEEGAIGDIVMLDFYNDRYSAEGAWQYPIPPDASKKTVDFDTFLGNARKVPFEPKRFFRWRNYRDYGTGVAGDLFVHAFSTLNHVISSMAPIEPWLLEDSAIGKMVGMYPM